jgi:hypothetical protein
MDLNILPLARREGQDLPALPGLHITSQPRRPARGRQGDRLLLFFKLEGNLSLEQGQQDQLLAQLAQGFYQTAGAVTAAMRTVAETLNQYLLDRNLRSGSNGRQASGLLMIAVVREGRVILGQCGPMHAFRISPNVVEHFYDDDLAQRGLGQGRATPLTYFQTELGKDEGLLLCARPPAAWVAGGLSGAYGQGPESLRRRLFSQAGADLEAVLVMAKAGSGKVHLLSAAAAAQEEAAARPAAAAEAAAEVQAPPAQPPQRPDSPAPDRAAETGEAARPAPGLQPAPPLYPAFTETAASPINEAGPQPPASAQPGYPSRPFEYTPEGAAGGLSASASENLASSSLPGTVPLADHPSFEAAPPAAAQPTEPAKPGRWFGRRKREAAAASVAASASASAAVQANGDLPEQARRQPRSGPTPVMRGIAGMGAAVNRGSRGAARVSGSVLRRLLPGEGTLPSSVMAFFALAIPIMVVAAAMYVYLKEGVAKQYQAAFTAASQAADTARAETDPAARRQAWAGVLAAAQRAENYQVTDATRSLQEEAQANFDQLDSIRRIEFQPAIVGGLSSDARITRIVATEDDLYLLDDADGSVWRALRTTRGYEIDSNFACGPSLPGVLTVGPLIDIAPIPKGSELEGALLAMDGAGNLLQCAPGEQPLASSLAPPPAGWGTPSGFALDSGNLYVMDPHPQKNAVWAYWGGDFTSQPQLFFAEDVPPMADVVDLAVDKRDLYMLHADGHITLCTFSELGVSPTRCADPVPYTDSRPGHEGQPFKPDHAFTQILTTQPPDPSLYLLESQAQAIYHFSLRLLNLQKQMRPVTLRPQGVNLSFPDDPATSFALSPDGRVAFMALGNQVFYAGTP